MKTPMMIMIMTMTKKMFSKSTEIKQIINTDWDIDSIQHRALIVFKYFYHTGTIVVNNDISIDNNDDLNIHNINVNISLLTLHLLPVGV